ncbi:protein disulfide-isomerase precursor [Cladophialophora chaetospira]|uniref:Protein disulfide-isomerase n=1 Tax=Cladophialophora chaetospira TaxID=386627 RepID=A0AA39CD69_9EURO|nr:protein disulfide-isomerase precursor [Cladophialophora chaetospira]
MLISACAVLGTLTTAVYGWQHSSSANFHSTVDSNDLTLAAFVVPWTVPCISLAAEWEAAKSQLPESSLITIDCSNETSFCAQQNVHSYPAIRLFRGGSEHSERYRGPRKTSAFVPFVKRASLPVVSTVDAHGLVNLLAIEGITFVAYLNEDDNVTRSHFTKVAGAFRDRFVFAITSDKDLAKRENIERFPSIVAYKTDIGDREVLHGKDTLKRSLIEEWVVEAGKPLINELTRQTEMSYLSVRPHPSSETIFKVRSIPTDTLLNILQSHKLLGYIFVSNDSQRASLRRELHPVAKTYKDYVNFVTIDSEEYGHMAVSLGLSGNHYPAFTVYSAWKDQVFPFSQAQPIKVEAVEAVEAFLLEILQDQRKPWDPRGGRHDEL